MVGTAAVLTRSGLYPAVNAAPKPTLWVAAKGSAALVTVAWGCAVLVVVTGRVGVGRALVSITALTQA